MKENKIILIVVFMMFALGFGVDLYTPSFPAMTKAFATAQQMIQLTITTYFLGYVLGLIMFGPLMDAVGRKKPLLSGLLFYTFMSLSAAFAPNITTLLILRFFQGVGVCFIGVGFRSILADTFTGKKLATSLNYASMSYRVSPIIAPFIGGFLEVYFGWSSNFYFLALLGICILAVVLFFLPETHFDHHPFRLHTIITNYAKLIKSPLILSAGACMGTGYGMMIIFNLIGPFFIQDVLNYSPILYGNIALIIGAAALVGSITNRLLLQRFEVKQLIAIGIYLTFCITVTQAILSLFFPLNLFCFAAPVFGLMFMSGLISSNIMTQVFEKITGSKGTLSAFLGVIIIATATLFTGLSTFLKSATIKPFAFGYLTLATLNLLIYLFIFKKAAAQSNET